MEILKYTIVAFAAGLTLSAQACTILEFGADNLLSGRQNRPEINFQELEAFASGVFSTRPIFPGHDPRFDENLTSVTLFVSEPNPGRRRNPNVVCNRSRRPRHDTSTRQAVTDNTVQHPTGAMQFPIILKSTGYR
jgi:hypothetical protein